MSSYELSPRLISKIEQVINYDMQVVELLAEIAHETDHPHLRAIVTSIIGDENGHLRLFALLLALASDNNTFKNRR
jgi:rubrerythrin